MVEFERRQDLILQLGFRAEGLPALRAYIDLLWAANEELNLISRKMTFAELIDNHVIDCLLPLRQFPAGLSAAADFGAGGGLPGVIYALQFPEMTYHLYEKSPLKQNFLQRCAALAPNLRVHGEIPSQLTGVQLVTARAFKPIDVLLEVSRKYYLAGGKYFLLKGRRERIEEEMTAARKNFKDLIVRIEPLRSPLLKVERHLVCI